MPFTRTWTEELVAEWLHLDGFLVETNFPVPVAGGSGGRRETDIVGARIRVEQQGQVLEIRHIEVGQLIDNPQKNLERIQKKFGPEVCTQVEQHFTRRLGFSGVKEYQRLVVSDVSRISDSTKQTLVREGYRVYESFHEFLKQEVLPTLERRPSQGTLPGGLWFLTFLEYLRTNHLLELHSTRRQH
ncbi:MAG: hypothetical protein HYY01_01720 [Chloroflexi bacterium]|nr:hypothetical protein [Chloroflexota bacterium]